MTKRDKIFQHLKGGGFITQWSSMTCFRLLNLKDTIHVLRNRGYNIEKHMTPSSDGNSKFARYYMPKAEQQRLMGAK